MIVLLQDFPKKTADFSKRFSEWTKKISVWKENLAFSESEAFLHFISKQPKVKRDICFVFRNRAIAKFFHFGLKKYFSKSNFFSSLMFQLRKKLSNKPSVTFLSLLSDLRYFFSLGPFLTRIPKERERERERACVCLRERVRKEERMTAASSPQPTNSELRTCCWHRLNFGHFYF